MASTNKTKNYKLNQWLGSDYMKRDDLNSDNELIDAALKNNADALSAEAAARSAGDSALRDLVSSETAAREAGDIALSNSINNINTSFAANVRYTVLTGLSTAMNSAIAATDTVLVALSKLQTQINNIATTIRSTVLTGFSTTMNTAVTATDTVLIGISKLQAQINNLGVKSYGNVTYADSLASSSTLTKNIAIGNGKNYGNLVIMGMLGPYRGIYVTFGTNNEKSIAVGIGSSSRHGNAWSRRFLGSITSITSNYESGYGVTGKGNLIVKECYISGNNLAIVFENTGTSADTLNCQIDWEVWQ